MPDNERNQGGDRSQDDEIKVTDRRLFSSDGSLREAIAEEREEQKPEPPREPRKAEPAFERRSLEEPQGVDFTMLINAMAQPALIFLGEVPHPGTGKPEINLEQARLQIDLLDVLRIKTRGNLSPDEEGLLDRVLYELRMRWVARSSRSGG
jgi:uncharacterized protein DUF1844